MGEEEPHFRLPYRPRGLQQVCVCVLYEKICIQSFLRVFMSGMWV